MVLEQENSSEYYKPIESYKSNIIFEVTRIFLTIIFIIFGTFTAWIMAPFGLLHPALRRAGYKEGWLPLDIVQYWWARTILKMLCINLVVKKSYKVPIQGSVIVPNHVSFIDFIALSASGVNARFVMKYEVLYLLPFIFVLAWIYGHVPINRKNRETSIKAINRLGGHSHKIKRHIVIFPEGTRTSSNKLQKFKKGAFYLAVQTGMPISPVLISGAINIWPRDKWIPRAGKIKIEFLDPIKSDGCCVDYLLLKTHRAIDKAISNDKFECFCSTHKQKYHLIFFLVDVLFFSIILYFNC